MRLSRSQTSLAQLLFLLPGLLASWIFSQILLAEQGTAGIESWRDYVNIVLFSVALIQLAVHEYRWMHKAAPEL
jgi:hypothetical protein